MTSVKRAGGLPKLRHKSSFANKGLSEAAQWACTDPSCGFYHQCAADRWASLSSFVAGMAEAIARLIEGMGKPQWLPHLQRRVEEVCALIERLFCEYQDSCTTYGKLDCNCLRDWTNGLYYRIQEFFSEIRRKIREYEVTHRVAPQRDPAFVGVAVATVMLLAGATLATLLSGGTLPITAEVVSLIITAFPRREHPELEALARRWVESYLEQQLPISGLTVGEKPTGLPMTLPTVAELDPVDVGQRVFDLHIAELEGWLTDYATEQAQIIGKA